MNNLLLAVSAATLLSVSTFTSALPVIDGQIGIVGTASYTIVGTAVTEINFPIDPIVINTTGSFSTIPILTPVTYPNPLVLASIPLSVWAVGGFDFILDTISLNTVTTVGTVEFVNIAGTGVIKNPGVYEDSEGSWSYSAQSTPGGFGDSNFSFSSTTVPEPTTIALFGCSLLAFGLSRRKRSSSNTQADCA